jgi:hypothetical protein
VAERKMPFWAVSNSNLANGDVNKLDPGSSKQTLGFIIEKPLVQTMNWLLNLVGHFVKANNEIKIVAGGYEAEAGETVLMDNSSAAVVGSLPALPVDRQKVSFGSVQKNSINQVSISSNGNSIMELGVDSLILDIDDRVFEFVWSASNLVWEVSLGNLRGRIL